MSLVWDMGLFNDALVRPKPVTAPVPEVLDVVLAKYGMAWQLDADGKCRVQDGRHLLEFDELSDLARWADYWCLGVGLQ